MSKEKTRSLAKSLAEIKSMGWSISVPNPEGDIAKAIRDEAERQDMAYDMDENGKDEQ